MRFVGIHNTRYTHIAPVICRQYKPTVTLLSIERLKLCLLVASFHQPLARHCHLFGNETRAFNQTRSNIQTRQVGWKTKFKAEKKVGAEKKGRNRCISHSSYLQKICLASNLDYFIYCDNSVPWKHLI